MAIARFYRSLSQFERVMLFGLVVLSFIPTFGALLRLLELAGGPVVLPPNPRAVIHPVAIALHVIASFVFCIGGAFQLLPSARRNHPDAHRLLGRWVGLAGIAAALTGMWMTHYFVFPAALQGSTLYVARMIVGGCMVGCIAWAVFAIRSGNLSGHRKAMLRAYAIGQGASTQTFLSIGWIVTTGEEPAGLPRDILMVCGWVLNLSIVEFATLNIKKPLSEVQQATSDEALTSHGLRPHLSAVVHGVRDVACFRLVAFIQSGRGFLYSPTGKTTRPP